MDELLLISKKIDDQHFLVLVLNHFLKEQMPE